MKPRMLVRGVRSSCETDAIRSDHMRSSTWAALHSS